MRKIFIFTALMAIASCASKNGVQKVGSDELSDKAYLDSMNVDVAVEDTVVTIPRVEFVLRLDAEQRDSDHYTCDYEWDGTGNWFESMQSIDDDRAKLLQDTIRAVANGEQLKRALDMEVKSWAKVTKTFDKMVDGQGELGFTSGQGSVSMENARWAKVSLRCYRCYCLEEDYLSLTDSCISKKTTISTSKLFAYMDKMVNWLDVKNVDKEILRDRRGGAAQYKREFAACKRDVDKAKAAFNAWIEVRQTVFSSLKDDKSMAYKRDTQKFINSLANGF